MAKSSLPKWKWLPDLTPPPVEPRRRICKINLKPDASGMGRVVASTRPRDLPVVMNLITDINRPLGENADDASNLGSTVAGTGPGAAKASSVKSKRGKKAVSMGVMKDAKGFLDPTSPPPTPPLVVEGLLHRGSILSIGGASKSHKSFSLLEMALQVSCGTNFWSLKTVKGRVLYVNLELQEFEIYKRLIDILAERRLSLGNNELGIWNLRGFTPTIEEIVKQITDIYGIHKRKPSDQLALIIIDPIYKCYGERDENSASDISSLFGKLEELAADTNAAVAFAAHFTKGDSSAKAVIDRVSGSGVYGRYPDSILTVTDLKGYPDYYTVETVLRNFPSIDPICVEWEYPVMTPCVPPVGLATASPASTTGRAPKYSMADFVALVGAKPMTRSDWKDAAASIPGMGMPASTFKDYAREAIKKGLVRQISPTDKRFYDVTKPIPVPPSTTLSTPAATQDLDSDDLDLV